jgi:hypothetical protein
VVQRAATDSPAVKAKTGGHPPSSCSRERLATETPPGSAMQTPVDTVPPRSQPRRYRYGDAGGSDIQKFHMPCVVMWVVASSAGLCCGLMPVVVQKITG